MKTCYCESFSPQFLQLTKLAIKNQGGRYGENGKLYLLTSRTTLAGARYTFSFGDGTDDQEGRMCSEWPLIDRSDRAIAGRLPLAEARKGSAETAVCSVSHSYKHRGQYTVRVRVVASSAGAAPPRTWNLGGQVTVLPQLAAASPTTPVCLADRLCRVICRLVFSWGWLGSRVVKAKFHYTDPTGPARTLSATRTDPTEFRRKKSPCGSGRVRVVEFSY